MPSLPQRPTQNRAVVEGRPRVDESIIRRLRELHLQLTPLEHVRPNEQDFEAIWIIRSEISELEATASAQAKLHDDHKERRELAEKEARENAEKEASEALKKRQLSESALRAHEQRRSDAKRLIEHESLLLCRQCEYGTVEVECPTCKGFGVGDPRFVDEAVTAVCSNRRSTCRICGGTGVFTTARQKLVHECEQCGGAGDARVTCPVCLGGRIVDRSGTAIEPPPELNDLVIELLKRANGEA